MIYTFYDIESEVQPDVATALQRIEDATAEELDLLFSAATLSMMSLSDPPHIFTRVSPYWTDLTGWSEGDLLSEPWTLKVHPDEQGQTVTAITDLVEETQIVEIKLRFRKSDTTYINLVFNCLKCADGRLFGTHYEQQDPEGSDPL